MPVPSAFCLLIFGRGKMTFLLRVACGLKQLAVVGHAVVVRPTNTLRLLRAATFGNLKAGQRPA